MDKWADRFVRSLTALAGCGLLLLAPTGARAGDPPVRYTNPVIFADYSDPDVLRAGDEYYLVSSSFHRVPALPLLRSTDLVHWTIAGHVAQSLPAPAFDVPRRGEGVWAPSLRTYRGITYLFYGDPDRGIFMATAPHPAGPWSPPVCIQEALGWIDPCPFWDEDGKAYLVHAWAKSRAGFNSILTIRPMSPDGRKILGEGRMLFDGRKAHPTIEGPKMYRRNGYYYVFAPAGGVKTGWQTVLRSRHPLGPYEDRVVLARGSTDVNGPHQGAWVETPDGRSWFLHFQYRGAFGRVVHLQPMRWVDDWPVIGSDPDGDGIGEPVTSGPIPVPGGGSVRLQTGDDFDSGSLGVQWAWQANPRQEWYSLTADRGKLRLYAIPSPSAKGNLREVPNLLTQMLQGPSCIASATMTFFPGGPGEQAGLAVVGANAAWIGLESTTSGMRLVYAESPGGEVPAGKPLIETRPWNGPAVCLRVTVDTAAICRFAASADGKQFEQLGGAFAVRDGDWVGARVGLFCTGSLAGGERTTRGWVDVDGFDLQISSARAVGVLPRPEGPLRLTVAPDGSGDHRTIQEAIDAVPEDHKGQAIITVRKGLYREKLWIHRSRITILGEDRDSTRIVYAELRSAWQREHGGSDRGAAVVNIDSLVSDIVLANLTVVNVYGLLYGSHDHQFAIRGGGTRVVLLDCTVRAEGGDTVSLWNRESGMYYHAGCTFEGWVDYVCPRGWCYITGSSFFGHNPNASLWHDGSADPAQKFVLRNCRFDGVHGFALGRHHRDAQFVLVDCWFSPNMADRPIYRPPTSTAPDRWGHRVYMAGARRDGGPFVWMTDRLPPGIASAEAVTAAWTFDGRWDPEAALANLLPADYLSRRPSAAGSHTP